MKHLRETFTDQEFEVLKANMKANGHKNWHDYIMALAEWKIPRYTGKFSENYEMQTSDEMILKKHGK